VERRSWQAADGGEQGRDTCRAIRGLQLGFWVRWGVKVPWRPCFRSGRSWEGMTVAGALQSAWAIALTSWRQVGASWGGWPAAHWWAKKMDMPQAGPDGFSILLFHFLSFSISISYFLNKPRLLYCIHVSPTCTPPSGVY